MKSEASLTAIPAEADIGRMRSERRSRVRAQMAENGLDALVLLGNSNVSYTTGLVWPLGDGGRSNFELPIAVVLASDEYPHLFTPFPLDASLEVDLPLDHIHEPVYLDFDEGVEIFARKLAELLPAGATVAVDEWTHAMRRDDKLLFAGAAPADAGRVMSSVKVLKTADELSVMQRGLQITEAAVAEVQKACVPGVRGTDLTAIFLRSIFEHGAAANVLDPMWQVMPLSLADGPWTTTGDLACPLITTEAELVKGDVLWSDAGIAYGGYHSDFGRTWTVGTTPTTQQQRQYDTWRSIMDAVRGLVKAGVTAGDLTRAARARYGGRKPWMPHFYLGHGLGIESAEMPFVGSDLGEEFDDSLVLQSGMVLVLEPVVWEDGAAGYRAEEIMLVTENGYVPMSHYPYQPYEY